MGVRGVGCRLGNCARRLGARWPGRRLQGFARACVTLQAFVKCPYVCVQAACKRFGEHCKQHGIPLATKRGFSLSYDTDVPRQTGLSGSSAIIYSGGRVGDLVDGTSSPTTFPNLPAHEAGACYKLYVSSHALTCAPPAVRLHTHLPHSHAL